MTSSWLPACLLLMTACGVGGCTAWEYRPSPEQVEAFVKRRAFVVSAVHEGMKEPMPGTSYSDRYMSASDIATRVKMGLGSCDPDSHIRLGVKQFGRCFLEPGLGLRFDVELSEQLTKDAEAGRIARQINDYYARKLQEAEWHIDGGGSMYCDPNVVVHVNCWTDRGRGSNTFAQRPFTIREPYDSRRGYFRVLIAVRADPDAKRAHVTINYWGSIGR